MADPEPGIGEIEKPEVTMPAVGTVTEQERELGVRAQQEFDKGQFDTSINNLNTLLKTRSTDYRVIHNLAVAEFYQAGFRRTDDFRQKLHKVCIQAHINIDNMTVLDDVDQCTIYYNHAVLLYHTKQYKAAIDIVDKIFQFIEPTENLSRRSLFLLIELYLKTQQPEKAMGMIAYLEKAMFGNGKHQSPDKDGRETDKELAANEAWKPRISQYKSRCYIMLKSMKSCKREVKSLMNSLGMIAPVVYIKSNFEYLRGNYRKAIKVLNTAPQARSVMETGECPSVMYYNNLAIIHFHLRKHNLGAFYLRKALQEAENISKELHKLDHGKALDNRPLSAIGCSQQYELLYNMGIQLLHCGKPLASFDCLITVVQAFPTNPRLWLRIAECCIMVNRENNDEDRALSKKLEIIQGNVGLGIHRKIILGSGVGKTLQNSESAAMPVATMEFAALCISNALMLLPEDPTLESEPSAEVDEFPEPSKPFNENILVSASPSNPMRTSEVANLRCSILAAGAYVSLCLTDYIITVDYAERLLKQPSLSGAHRYLGNLYMAEALVSMDKIADAMGYLNPDNVTDVSVISPEQKQESEKAEKNGEVHESGSSSKESFYPWTPRDVKRARAIMLYNQASAHAIRGEYEKALFNLNKSCQDIGSPLPAHFYLLRLYLDLIEGRKKVAQGLIREQFCHVSPLSRPAS